MELRTLPVYSARPSPDLRAAMIRPSIARPAISPLHRTLDEVAIADDLSGGAVGLWVDLGKHANLSLWIEKIHPLFIAPDVWGVTMTFGIDHNGLSGGSGSVVKTSSTAPPSRPAANAVASADSSSS